MPNDIVKKAFEPYGKVQEVTRETWHVEGFHGVESTTRIVRLTLKEGMTPEQLPHQLRIVGCATLVVVPGRAPLCLRCRKTGHVRRDCRVPRCESCRRYGHSREDCSVTYASVTDATPVDETSDLIMDENEAEVAAGGSTTEGDGTKTANSPAAETPSGPPVPTTEKQEQAVSLSEECPPAAQDEVEQDSAETPGEQMEACVTPSPIQVPSATTPAKDAEDNAMEMDASGSAGKRGLEAAHPTTSTDVTRGLEQLGKLKGFGWKRGRYNPAPNIPPDIRRRGSLE